MSRHHWAVANTDCVGGWQVGGVVPGGTAVAAGLGPDVGGSGRRPYADGAGSVPRSLSLAAPYRCATSSVG